MALGVAFIGGVLTLTNTMNQSFDDLFASAYEGTDAVVRSSQTIDQGIEGEVRGDLAASLLPEVDAVDSVAVAEGRVEGFAQILDREGGALGASGFGPPTLGANWSEVEQLEPWELLSGRAPADDGEITTTQAQRALGLPDELSNIEVVAADGVSQGQVASDLQAALGDDVDVLTGAEITTEAPSDLREQLSFLTVFFSVFAAIAVIVGAFVIYNSFSIIVAQRTSEMALLRAVGASRRQVRRSVLVEAVGVGLIGSLVGFVVGLGIASALVAFMDIEGSLVIAPSAVTAAVLTGLVVTVVAAIVPARRASQVPPVAAMREVAIDTASRSVGRFATGLALLDSAAQDAGLRVGSPVELELLEPDPGAARARGVHRDGGHRQHRRAVDPRTNP